MEEKCKNFKGDEATAPNPSLSQKNDERIDIDQGSNASPHTRTEIKSSNPWSMQHLPSNERQSSNVRNLHSRRPPSMIPGPSIATHILELDKMRRELAHQKWQDAQIISQIIRYLSSTTTQSPIVTSTRARM